jgi:hypothetical protein
VRMRGRGKTARHTCSGPAPPPRRVRKRQGCAPRMEHGVTHGETTVPRARRGARRPVRRFAAFRRHRSSFPYVRVRPYNRWGPPGVHARAGES